MHWSPIQSRIHFEYQLRVVGRNAVVLREFLSEKAPPHVLLGVMGLTLMLLVLRSRQRWKLAWMLLTLVLFLGPFLVVIIQQRYLNPHVAPLGLLLCLMIALEWRPGVSTGTHVGVSWWRAGLALLILGSFLWGEVRWMYPMFQKRSSPTFRLMGRRIRHEGLEGPFASDSRFRGMLVAYHCGLKYVGFPPTRNADVAERMLHDLGVRFLMVWDEPRAYEQQSCAPLIVKNEGWAQVLRFHGATVYQFSGKGGAASRPATQRAPSAHETAPDSMIEDEEDAGDLAGAQKSGGPAKSGHPKRKK